jgi:multicomponent Na+:H+ antiporter subunit G
MVWNALGAAAVLSGAVFMALAALGVWRMPDVYNRLSASAKASTLGVLLMLLGAVVLMPERRTIWLALAIFVFVLLTAPLAAHMIGRATFWHTGPPLEHDDGAPTAGA